MGENVARRPLQADLEARRSSRISCRRDRRTGSARQRQADSRCAQCRSARVVRDPALHGRLGDQDQRRDDRGLGARRLARLHLAGAGRCRWPDHPMEFPADDGGLEDRAGTRSGLHHRPEAGRADPAQCVAPGPVIQEAGFPDGVVNILTGFGETAGAALAAHPDVDKVAFTGSTEVGKLIVQAAAGNLKKVSLELGGKSPAIVFPDADMDIAISGTSSAIFFNMGQCCTAGSRLYAHKRVFDRLMQGVADRAAQIRVGHGLDPETQLGPLVSDEQFKRVTGYLEAGRQQGAKVVTGGGRVGDAGYFVQPTVLTDTKPDMSVIREEIFGPVVCAIPFDDDDLDHIARTANDTTYGLAASIWTRDLGIAHKLARRIKAGTVWINTHNFGDPALPFGGFKQSGWGREMGYEAIELYTEVKAVAAALG